MTISVVIIVLNREEEMMRAVNSVRAFADEIVVAALSCSVETEKRAKSVADKFVRIDYLSDNSKAKNHACSLCSGDYIICLSPDEYVSEEGAARLCCMKKNLFADVYICKSVFMRGGETICYSYENRLIKSGICSWQGRTHEVLQADGKKVFCDVSIIKEESSDFNSLNTYYSMLKGGEEFSARDSFFFALELFKTGDYANAEKKFDDLINSQKTPSKYKILSSFALSECCKAMNKIEKAIESLMKSFCYSSPRAEACYEMGNLFVEYGEMESAAMWYEFALMAKEKLETDFSYIPDINFKIYLSLCHSYLRLGEDKRAKECYIKAKALNSKSEKVLSLKRYFEKEGQ